MAIQPSLVLYWWSSLRRKRVEVGRLYDDGFLYLKDDPGVWIQSNPDSVSSVRSLELEFLGYEGEKIGDSIRKLSQLTHLSIYGGNCNLKCLPNTLSRLHNLHHLELDDCQELEDLPPNFGDLSNLTTLFISGIGKLKELPANLGDLKFLASLFLYGCYSLRWLPWSITKLSNLRFLHLPERFRLETLPPHLNDSIIISVEETGIRRKTWKEIKTQITEIPIITEELAAQKTSTPGYLQFTGDPTLWIRHYNNYGLHSSVLVLDVDLGDWSCKGKIPGSIGELSQLTHLYISNGCLPYHLPPTFSRLTHLSLIHCTFECDTKSYFDSLGNLSTLTSLHLCPWKTRYNRLLPEHMDLPISLTHLTLQCFFESSIMASMVGKLSNLNTLTLSGCDDLESLPIKSLPIGLKHLEIIHSISQCMFNSCNQMQECLKNQLVNLKTLSYTCDLIKTLSSMIRLHNFRELKLKDCFSLQELPQDLDKLVKMCTLDVSGTRIQSLPNSIINLHNLRRLILPKCFKLDTLPFDFENKVMISVDDTDESYYKRKGYHNRAYGIINDCDYMTSDSIKEINEKFLEKFKPDATVTVIEQASQHRPSNHQPNATRIIEGSLLNGLADPTCNNNHNAFSSSLTQDEILPTRNEAAGTKPDVVAEYYSNAPMDFGAFDTDISNFPYRNNIPAVIMDYLVGWKDVEADGNCGFRCVAEVFHRGEKNWPMARQRILDELKAEPNVYQKIWDDDQCGEDHYMEIVADLFPIANCYQCTVMCFFVTANGLNPQLSATVLPWNVGAHGTRHTKELTIAHLGKYKHYILLDLKDDFPVPPIPSFWYDIIDKTVVDWDSPYVTRRQRWDRLTNCSRDSIHLDVIDDCNVNGGNIAVGENISQPNFSSQNHETENLQSNNWDGVVSDMAAEPSSKFHETNLSCENSQQAFQNGEVDSINLELEQGTSSSDSPNFTHGGSYNRALVKRQNKNPQGGVKHKSQKIEIPYTKHIGGNNGNNNAVGENSSHAIVQYNNRDVVTAEPSSNNLHETNSVGVSNQQVFQNEQIDYTLELEQGNSSCGRCGSLKGQDNIAQRGGVQHDTEKKRANISLERIHELKSRDLTLEAAATHLGVSRSTLKRRLKELGIKWSSKEEGMNPDTNRNETHSTCERNLSQPNSIDASNPTSHGQGVEHIVGSSPPTLSSHVPSEHNVVNNSTPGVVSISNEARTRPVVINEYCSEVNANTMQDHDPMDIEVRENNSHAHAIFGSRNQETEILKSNNWDGVMTFVSDIPAEPSFNLQETNSFGENNQQFFQNEHQIVQGMELEQDLEEDWLQHFSVDLFQSDHAQPFSDPTTNNNPNASITSPNHKIENLLTSNEAGTIPVVVNECHSDVNANKVQDHDPMDIAVSRSTLKRRLKELGIKWSSKEEGVNPDTNRKETHSTCERNLSQPNSMDASNPVSHGQGVEHIAGSSQPTLSYHVPSEHNVVNNSTPDVVTTTVGEPPLSTQYCMDSRLQRVEEHPNDGATPALVDTDLPPNERCSTFVVKATFNEDTAKFNFSLSSSIEELKDVVSKKLELEVGTFKIKYKDIDNDLVLMNDTSNLEEAVSLSRKSGSNVVRLSIFLKT